MKARTLHARFTPYPIILTLVAALTAGCGGQGDDESAPEVEQATTAALTASGQAEGQVFSALTAPSFGSGWIQGTLQSFTVNGTITGPAGGTATITGAGGASKAGLDLQLAITLEDWVVQETGQVLNGTLTNTYTIATLAPRSFTSTVKGTLKVGVKPAIPVVVDLQVSVTRDQLVFCGSVAGQPVGSGYCQ